MAAPSPRSINAVDPSLGVERAQHQGQHRERAAAGGRPGRSRPRPGRGRLRGVVGHRPAAGGAQDRRGDVFDRRACSSCAATARAGDRRPQGQAGGVRRARLGPGDPRRATCSTGSVSIPSAISRRSISTAPATARPWCSTAGPRRCGAAASAGPASRARRGAGGAVHRAGCRGGRAHPRQARRS